MSMNCLLLSRYGPLAASSRLRFYQYLPHLRSLDIQVEVAPFLDDRYVESLYAGRPTNWSQVFNAYCSRIPDLRRCRNFDLVWLEAEVLPWLPAWGETWMSRCKVPYVVDYDDAAFHRYDLHSFWPVRWFLGNKIDMVMKRAKVVVAGNEYLARRAHQAGAIRVEVLPTVVDLNRYSPAPSQSEDRFVIGWIGSPVTAGYLEALEPVLRRIGGTGNVLLRACGSGPIQWKDVHLDSVDWSEETEAQTIQTFHAGVMPLPKTSWAEGKCGYKLIQYMACGLPVVASPVGANRQIVRQSATGFLAESAEEWVQALTFLRDHLDARAQMGRAGRRDVETKYCLQVTAPRLGQLLLEAAGR
jgi:glycosyltransferase involved in cell wall biosynthesis